MDANETSRPYQWVLDYFSPKARRRVFSEFSADVDLMAAEVDENIFGGALAMIADHAKLMLCELDRHDVHALLTVADALLWEVVDESIVEGGSSNSSFAETLSNVSVAELAPLVAHAMVAKSISLGDEAHKRQVKLAPGLFFAAAALSELHAAARHDDVDWWQINGGYHSIQAARLLALATTTLPEYGHMPLVVEKLQAREKARKGGVAAAANAKPNPEREQALECKRRNPALSAVQIKNRAKLRASERTIRGWISAVR